MRLQFWVVCFVILISNLGLSNITSAQSNTQIIPLSMSWALTDVPCSTDPDCFIAYDIDNNIVLYLLDITQQVVYILSPSGTPPTPLHLQQISGNISEISFQNIVAFEDGSLVLATSSGFSSYRVFYYDPYLFELKPLNIPSRADSCGTNDLYPFRAITRIGLAKKVVVCSVDTDLNLNIHIFDLENMNI